MLKLRGNRLTPLPAQHFCQKWFRDNRSQSMNRSSGTARLIFNQVSNWRLRHTVPSDRLAEVIVALFKLKAAVDVARLLETR